MDPSRKTFFVRQDPRGWLFGRDGEVLGIFSSETHAVAAGRKLIEQNEGASLVILASDGTVTDRFFSPAVMREPSGVVAKEAGTPHSLRVTRPRKSTT